ncbi:MAG: methyltransferase [Methylovulum sp.]|uniref:methyltransferase n=1 Tax=Methylovulum sp. TaxID=1916980 RepID=UPI0026224C1A|nr:methyltransferase [Methylovulum sp.]MDD2722672.1 methyltransferase [Methylovulum sp.]MDD5125161.1 methyltransferase [Methylovulum sp.]
MPETDQCLKVAQGEFTLNRLPKRPNELLRAFDAADEYLLDYVAGFVNPAQDAKILLLNDSFGALAVALHAWNPWAMSDSYLSQQATRLNLAINGLHESDVNLLGSVDVLTDVFDLVLIKVPKTLALLEDQLIRLHPHLTATTQVIVAGMVKTLPAKVWKLLEQLVGATTTSLAKKKARLIFVQPNPNLIVPVNPYPVYYTLENTDYRIANHANVFSRDSLDIGTRFFLQHLPKSTDALDIIDLGCGNGLLGLIAAERNPQARLLFVDESFMAIASAEENFRQALGDYRIAGFRVGDGLTAEETASADIILCNPPFHQQNTIGDQIAISLFKESRRVLRKNGELWVIGNRHLNYHITLKRWFDNVSAVASNTKFVILKASY